MKIAITTLGTRGDLQPYIALGLGLKQAGYDVLLISSKNEKAFATGFGLAYHALNVDIQKIMEGEVAQKMAKGDNPVRFILSHLQGSVTLKQMMVAVQEEVWEACRGADAIIYHPGMPNGYFIGRELGIPSIMASPFPVTPTKDYPSILFYSGPRLGRLYNALTHAIFERAFWAITKSAVKAFWSGKSKPNVVGTSPPTQLQVSSGMPVVYGYSEQFFRRPAEWPANVQVTGHWSVPNDANWTPPDDLVAFINAGPPPVYVGFGSMKDASTANETLDIVSEAIKQVNQRAVVALGWNTLHGAVPSPNHLFLVESAPHAWLFPRMAAVVHHGGAGTTAAGLMAGKPTIIIPHSADQPAWGKRVYELGVGSKPIPKKKLSVNALVAALQTALDPLVAVKAEELGRKLRTENGVEKAVKLIDSFLKMQRQPVAQSRS